MNDDILGIIGVVIIIGAVVSVGTSLTSSDDGGGLTEQWVKDYHGDNDAVGYTTDLWVNESGDMMNGTLNMDTHLISNLPTPSQSHHAANKQYVDDNVEEVNHTNFVNTTGDTMNGNLNMGSNAITNIASLSISIKDDSQEVGYSVIEGDDGIKLRSPYNDVKIVSGGQSYNSIILDAGSGVIETTGTFDNINMGGNSVRNMGSTQHNDVNLGTCDSSTEGEIRYNDTAHHGCNGTHWNALY